MNVSISPSARIIALVGLLCACALGSAALLLARHASSKTASPPTPALHHAKPAAVTSMPREHPSLKRTVTVTPKPKEIVVTSNGRVPSAVAAALKNHFIVVAALYAPDGATDPTAVAEAQAGARLAGVGFVKLDVLDETVASQLARVSDKLSDPAVLVFERNGSVAVHIEGFADRDVVAQAAENAALK
jgi:hypothetical protein